MWLLSFKIYSGAHQNVSSTTTTLSQNFVFVLERLVCTHHLGSESRSEKFGLWFVEYQHRTPQVLRELHRSLGTLTKISTKWSTRPCYPDDEFRSSNRRQCPKTENVLPGVLVLQKMNNEKQLMKSRFVENRIATKHLYP